MGATATIGAALFGVGASIIGGNKSKSQAAKAMQEQENRARELENQMKAQSANQDADKTRAREEAKTRQRQAALGATGQQDTILTSPIGLPGQASGGGKTLLGS